MLYMLYRPLAAISFLFLCISILNPIHTLPLGSFFSEFFCFIAAFILLPIFFKDNLEIPKITLLFLLISLVPLLQYLFGQIFFFSIAFFSFVNIFVFWLMIVVGFNMSSKDDRILDISFFLSVFFLFVSLVSSFLSFFQWLGLSTNSSYIMSFYGSRPYANMAQPNHLATYLCFGIFSCWYLFEKHKLNVFFSTVFYLILVFSVVLTQSRTGILILFFSFLFIIFNIKKYSFNISKRSLLGLFIYFLVCLFFVPLLNMVLIKFFNISKDSSFVDRLNSGYERLAIWEQMLYAIESKPWLGYGWGQTTLAQFNVIDKADVHVWLKSSHNIIIDLLVWCGLPLGIAIILFLIYFYIMIFFNMRNKKDIFSFLVVSAIIIHSMLEFPMYYSYFFIPVGLLIGCVLRGGASECVVLNRVGVVFIFILSIGGACGVFREYIRIDDNLFAGKLHAMGDSRVELNLPYHLYLFDFFEARARWFALYPKMKVDEQQLNDAKKMVQTYLKPYDLYKYAQLLAFNGKERDAKKQLKILYALYGMEVSYESLITEVSTVSSMKN